MSTPAPTIVEGATRRPSSSTSVRAVPSARRLIRLAPALMLLPIVERGVAETLACGSRLMTSATLGRIEASMKSAPIAVVGVGRVPAVAARAGRRDDDFALGRGGFLVLQLLGGGRGGRPEGQAGKQRGEADRGACGGKGCSWLASRHVSSPVWFCESFSIQAKFS